MSGQSIGCRTRVCDSESCVINPANTAPGDRQFYAEADGPATDLLLLDWQLVLPF